MDIIDVNDLAPLEKLPTAIYDLASGTRLCMTGSRLTTEMIAEMRASGIRKLARPAHGETAQNIIRQINFREVPLSDIPVGQTVAFDVYTPDAQLLIASGTRLTDQVVLRLRKRHISSVLVARDIDAESRERAKNAQLKLGEIQNRLDAGFNYVPKNPVADPKALTPHRLRLITEELEVGGRLQVKTEPEEALAKQIHEVDNLEARPESAKNRYVELYKKLIEDTTKIFEHLARSQSINGDMVGGIASYLVKALVEDRQLLLNTLYLPVGDVDYLAQHSVNMAILAVNVAAAGGYSFEQVMEVGFSALLVDVGMLKVPEAIRFKKGPLNSQEQLEVMRHTLYGIDLLQNVRQLPAAAPIVAFQAHERIDGSGYPHAKKRYGIHDYAKLVAVADVYDAQVGLRPYRQESRLPYLAVEEVLKMSAAKKLDAIFTRSLLTVTSLFPVGSWVQLNTGEIAKVIAAHRTQFTRPTVAVLLDENRRPCPARRIDLSAIEGFEVVSAVHHRHEDPMAGF